MADIVDVATRSRMMSGIRGKNTKPELVVRKALHARGYRYVLHRKDLPGRPDIVFPSKKAVIFVHGCFWHGHNCSLFKMPATRPEFWAAKIGGNQKRDLVALDSLRELGWRSLVIWECAIRKKSEAEFDEVIATTISWLNDGNENKEIRE